MRFTRFMREAVLSGPRGFAAAIACLVVLCVPAATNAGMTPTDDEAQIGSDLIATRHHPAIAAGRYYYDSFFVVWDESSAGSEGVHIWGTDTYGTPGVDDEVFQVDAPDSSINEEPDVARGPDGHLIVVWRRDPADGTRPYLVGKQFSRWWSSEEFRINTERDIEGDYYLGAPEIAAASDDSFVVVWASGAAAADTDSGPRSDVFARRFNRNSMPIGDDIPISAPGGTGSEETEFRPDVAKTANGEFVVAWARGQYTASGTEFATYVQRLDSLARPVGPEIRAGNGGLAGPRLDAGRSGGFRVVWSNHEIDPTGPDAGGQLLLRSFDDEGAVLGGTTIIAGDGEETFAGVGGTAVAHGDADELVLAWTSFTLGDVPGPGGDGDGSGVFTGAFHERGAPFGDTVQGNQIADGDQVNPAIAIGYDGAVLIVWEAGNIHGRRFELAIPKCADTDANDFTTVRDALFILQAAVGARACETCVCDADGSGDATAADALAVLRDSVGIRTTFACPACADPFARTFSLESDVGCYGVHAELEGLPSSFEELNCTLDPALAAAGCEVTLSEYYYPPAFDARGCTINGGPLFTCHLSAADAEEIALIADVACGCGCAAACPTAPQVCTTIDGDDVCSAGQSLLAAAPPAMKAATVFTTIAQEQTSVTSSTTCGTCCDYTVSADVELADEVTVTELLIRFDGTASPECNGAVECDVITEAGGPGYIRTEGDVVEMCISDRDGITGPLTLANCSALVGDFGYGAAEIVRALDGEFHPVVPAVIIK